MAQKSLPPLVPVSPRPRPLRPLVGRAFALLAALELLVFGVWSRKMGFYDDDWMNLERLANAGGVWAGIKFYAGLILERPMESLQYPLLFAIGGLHTFPYQVCYILAEIAQGWLLYWLLFRLTKDESLSLLSSAVVLVFPTHAVTHLWLGSSALIFTLDLTLASLLMHLRWLEGGKTRDLLLGQAFYLAALLDYEVAAFLPLMLAGALWARDAGDGAMPRGGFTKLAKRFAPYAASLIAALFWQRAIVSMVLERNPRPVEITPEHFFAVYGAGLECVANRVVDVFYRMMPVAWEGLGFFAALAALVVAAGTAWLWARDAEPATASAMRTALGAAAGALVGACLPFALSDYSPMVYGIMSRTNGIIAIAGGMLWACGLHRLFSRSREAALGLLGSILFCMIFSDWGNSLQWARAYHAQEVVLGRLYPKAQNLPPRSVVLLTDTPQTVEPGGAWVFGSYDVGAALRILTERKDLSADMVGPQSRFFKDGVEVRPGVAYRNPVYYFSNKTAQGAVKN